MSTDLQFQEVFRLISIGVVWVIWTFFALVYFCRVLKIAINEKQRNSPDLVELDQV